MAKFEKGHKKVGGRKKGTPNKATPVKEALRRALENAHEDGAEGYLLELAREDPRVFMTAVLKLIPTSVETKVEHEQTVTVRRFGSGRQRGIKEETSNEEAAT